VGEACWIALMSPSVRRNFGSTWTWDPHGARNSICSRPGGKLVRIDEAEYELKTCCSRAGRAAWRH
jgi:hypothetical protein